MTTTACATWFQFLQFTVFASPSPCSAGLCVHQCSGVPGRIAASGVGMGSNGGIGCLRLCAQERRWGSMPLLASNMPRCRRDRATNSHVWLIWAFMADQVGVATRPDGCGQYGGRETGLCVIMDVYGEGGRWVWSWGQMGVVIMEAYKQVVGSICRCTSPVGGCTECPLSGQKPLPYDAVLQRGSTSVLSLVVGLCRPWAATFPVSICVTHSGSPVHQ